MGQGAIEGLSSRAVVIQCELGEPLAIPCPQEAFVLVLAQGFFGFYWGRNSVGQALVLLVITSVLY